MQYGMIGLGRMGGNMSRRIARAGLEVIAWDRAGAARSAGAGEPGIRPVETLETRAAELPAPRAVWMMLPAGGPTEQVLERLQTLLSPGDVIIDGANAWQEMIYLLLPTAMPGLASTALLLIILSWNEAFWSLNLTSVNAAPLTVFIASYSNPEGLFWAKLSAASTLAVAPILVVGWFSQRQLVRGLTFGAVK